MRALPRGLLAAPTAAVIALGCAVSSASETPAPLEVRHYSATVLSGTGRYARVGGALAITLLERQSGPSRSGSLRESGPTYSVSITLSGARCTLLRRAGRRCVSLSGSLRGSAIRVPTNPDLPGTVRITRISGRTNLLGAVSGHGVYRGTGFILRGRRRVWLALGGHHGSLTVSGEGPSVRGFSAP